MIMMSSEILHVVIVVLFLADRSQERSVENGTTPGDVNVLIKLMNFIGWDFDAEKRREETLKEPHGREVPHKRHRIIVPMGERL